VKRLAIGQPVVEWVARRTNEFGNFGAAVGIGLERFDEGKWGLIAGVVYSDFNGVNVNMHVASDGSRNWMTKEYLWTCFDYPFNQAKVNRITGLVGEGNVQARRFNERIGFELETRIKGAHPSGDLLIYVLWRKNCKWVNHENLYKNRLAVAA